MDGVQHVTPTHPPWRRSSGLVGREPEQLFLREELAAASAGRGRLVLLGGEAGIGKTTLAQDLVAEAKTRGAFILSGHCYDLSNTPPYGPWLDLFASFGADAALPSPPRAFAGGMLTQVTDQSALFAEVRGFFSVLAATQRVLVVLEDLHWADPASLELLRHFSPHLHRWPILLLGTYRIDEPTRYQPLYQHLPALVRESDSLRFDLRRLNEDALRALVNSRYALSTTGEAELTAYLARHSEGNPFFATELLRTLEEEHLLNSSVTECELTALDRVIVPPFLRQVIEGRIERLGEEVRLALAIAAVIGQEVPLGIWAAVANLDDELLLTIVESAVGAHILATERDGATVHFVHALTREALYEGVIPPRRWTWHRQIAEALMNGARPDPDAVAYHLQEAGDPRAWEWLERAGERAQRAYAWRTAIARFQAAAAQLDDVPGLEGNRGRLLYRVSRLQRFADPAGGLISVAEAGRLAASVGNAILAAEVFYCRGTLLCYTDHFGLGLAELEMGIAALEALPLPLILTHLVTEPWLADALPSSTSVDLASDEAAMALLHEAGFHYRRGAYPWFLAAAGRVHEATALSTRFLMTLAKAPETKHGVHSISAFSQLGLGVAAATLGRQNEANQAFAKARETFAGLDHHALVAFTLLSECRDVACTYGAANPARRRGVAQAAEAALDRASGALHPDVSPLIAHLACWVLDGAWDDALRLLRDLPDPANAFLRREVTTALAFLSRHRSEPEGAWEQIRARFPGGPPTEPGDHILLEGLFLQRLAAELSLDAGDLDTARDWLTAHDAWLDWSGGVLAQADGRLAWARYHRAVGDNDLALAAATEALSLASNPDQPLVRLAAHRLLAELLTATDHHEGAEVHLATALTLANACEAPFERALTLLASAELHAASGDTDEARAALDEARQICLSLGAAAALARANALAARLPAEPPGEGHPAGLSPREFEVLRLLSQRHTDKEIADALFLGPRTVQSHVAHILNKLGVANRREAATEAARLGLL